MRIYKRLAKLWGSGANMYEGRNKSGLAVETMRRVLHSKLQGQLGA